MPYSIRIPNGILNIPKTDFYCESCGQLHEFDDYEKRLEKSKDYIIYMRCKRCKVVIGITTAITGDTATWLKKDEKVKNSGSIFK